MDADEASKRAVSFLFYDLDWPVTRIADYCDIPQILVMPMAALGMGIRVSEYLEEQRLRRRISLCGRAA